MASKQAARQFAEQWKNRGDERQDTQTFWISLLQQVFGIGRDNVQNVINFEVRTSKKKKGKDFKDAVLYRYDRDREILIEQKSYGIPLDKQIKQSDGETLTPFEQAKRYDDQSIVTDKARWIITCNFSEFWIYDMTLDGAALYEPVKKVQLSDLANNLSSFAMLSAGTEEQKPNFNEEVAVSVKAGELVGKMYDAFEKQYKHDENGKLSEEQKQALNKLCVRLVFCLYAEDSGLFRDKQFHDYMESYPTPRMRRALIDLFDTLDTPVGKRDPYLESDVAAFPYVNGGLFAGEIEIPNFTDEIRTVLLDEESSMFDWAAISPTIFGAVFESTLNPQTRRSGGMHYTSIENIHKVIDPLFLDDLNVECDKLLSNQSTTEKQLLTFQNKLASLRFLDPACGSGNFLTETYLSLRRIENRVIKAYSVLMQMGNIVNPIKISIKQFYGIEINDFAVSVAQTALWIAEHKMFRETEKILVMDVDFLPLKTFTHIHEGNALQMDWNDVIPAEKLTYVMGNPPFVGHKNVNSSQKADMKRLFNNKQGRLDYVSAWYLLASRYIQKTNIECAFVSTNTVVQGTHVSSLWTSLMSKYGIIINFAHRTFKWTSEAPNKASVFCVVIGFSTHARSQKFLYYYADDLLSVSEIKRVENITPYLEPDDTVFVKPVGSPLCNAKKMIYGNIPRDGGFYTFTDLEKEEFVKKEPASEKYFYHFLGSKEYINGTYRWILFLRDCPPSELKKMPLVMERINSVRNFRLSSKAKEIQEFAKTPTLFAQQTQPLGKDFIIIPIVSSSRREYIPMGYVKGNTLVNNRVFVIPDGDLYTFGILMSRVHNAWMRRVSVRLKNDYSYSKDLTYNTFPWPSCNDEQKKKIEETAQEVIKARELFPHTSLNILYDPLTMPVELRKAHEANDKAVMDAYGFDHNMTEPEIVAELMKMYQDLIEIEK